MERERMLTLVCSVCQIAGLVVIVFEDAFAGLAPVLIGISGFAAVVNYFLPPVSPKKWALALRATGAV